MRTGLITAEPETVHGMRMVIAVNALGLPAGALPVGIADGLPGSVRVIGRPLPRGPVLEATTAIEDRLGVITPIDPK